MSAKDLDKYTEFRADSKLWYNKSPKSSPEESIIEEKVK
jgi:hypothetical protein